MLEKLEKKIGKLAHLRDKVRFFFFFSSLNTLEPRVK